MTDSRALLHHFSRVCPNGITKDGHTFDDDGVCVRCGAADEPPHMYWCPRDYCGWTGARRPIGGACPECLLGNDERVMVIEG